MTILNKDIHSYLYDAQNLTEKIESSLIENGGEITPALDELLAFRDYNQKALSDSVDCVAMTVERLDLSLEYYNQQIQNIKEICDGIAKAKTKLLFNLEQTMDSLGIEKVCGTHRDISFRKNPPKVDLIDETLIPDEFKKITIIQDINKKEISESLKKGIEVNGARLIQGRSLKISVAKPQLNNSLNKEI